MDFSTIPYGRVRKVFTAPFEVGRPSWLEVTGGTGSVMPNTPGYYEVSGTTTVTLRHTFGIELGAYEQVAVYADGVHVGSPAMSLGLSFKDPAPPERGVSIWSAPGASAAVFRAFNCGQPDVPVPYYWGGPEATRKRNLGLVVRPKLRQVLLVMDDQVIWEHTEPAMVLGSVRGIVDAGGPSGGVLRLAQYRLVLDHN